MYLGEMVWPHFGGESLKNVLGVGNKWLKKKQLEN